MAWAGGRHISVSRHHLAFLPFCSSARSSSLISSCRRETANSSRRNDAVAGHDKRRRVVRHRTPHRPGRCTPLRLQSPRMSQCCHTAPPGLRDRSWRRPNLLHRRQSIILTGLQHGRHNTSGSRPAPGREYPWMRTGHGRSCRRSTRHGRARDPSLHEPPGHFHSANYLAELLVSHSIISSWIHAGRAERTLFSRKRRSPSIRTPRSSGVRSTRPSAWSARLIAGSV